MKKLLRIKLVKSLMILAFMVSVTGLSTRSIIRTKDHYKPYETTEKIWMPEEYSMVNQVDGRYMPVENVYLSGTAVHVPFEDFKENFSSKKINVIIRTDGTVYYIVEQTGRKFFAKVSYVPYTYIGSRSHRCEIIISDLVVKNFYGQDANSISHVGFVMSLFWGISIGASCYLIYYLLAWRIRKSI